MTFIRTFGVLFWAFWLIIAVLAVVSGLRRRSANRLLITRFVGSLAALLFIGLGCLSFAIALGSDTAASILESHAFRDLCVIVWLCFSAVTIVEFIRSRLHHDSNHPR